MERLKIWKGLNITSMVVEAPLLTRGISFISSSRRLQLIKNNYSISSYYHYWLLRNPSDTNKSTYNNSHHFMDFTPKLKVTSVEACPPKDSYNRTMHLLLSDSDWNEKTMQTFICTTMKTTITIIILIIISSSKMYRLVIVRPPTILKASKMIDWLLTLMKLWDAMSSLTPQMLPIMKGLLRLYDDWITPARWKDPASKMSRVCKFISN